MIFYWISFFFHFFKEIKKCFFYGILSALLKNLEIWSMKNSKKKRKMLRKRHYFQQQLESHFWPRKHWNLVFSIYIEVVENWISFKKKKSIPNQLEFWAASYGQNMEHVQKITQIQHHLQFSFKISNGDQHQICSSLSNGLIPSLSFRREFFWKINWIEKHIYPVKNFKNA